MRILISVILLSCLTLHAFSTPDIRTGVLPSWLIPVHPDRTRQPSAEEISNGYYYELQDQQTNLSLCTEYFHTIRHIVNGSGVQDAAEVSVTFSPEYQHVVFHRIEIIRDGAVLDQLHAGRIKVVEDEPDAGDFEYRGLKRAYLDLKDVRKGDRIDIAYSIIGFNPVLGGKYSARQYFTRSTAICNYFRTIITSPNRRLRFLAHGHAALPDEELSGTRLIYRWNNPALNDEADAAGRDVPNVGITEYNDWGEVVSWGLSTFNHYRYRLPPSLLEKIAAWRRTAAGNQDLFANLATRFVQNEIRYLGLEMGTNSHRPHPPAEVFADRFGDCKDKSLLLVCILRHEGIPAFATLINTDDGETLPGCAPSPGLFNHTIVGIQRPGGQWLYVDPTLAGQRGELSKLYIPDYGYTLLVREGEDSLRTMPVAPGHPVSYTIFEQLDARFDDTSRFSISTTYGGGAADKIRRTFDDNSRRDIEAGYIRYYAAFLPGIAMDSHLRYHDDSLNNEITTRESYAIPSIWSTDKEGRRSFGFCVKSIRDNLPDPFRNPSGISLALGCPMQIQYTLRLNLPEDWEFGAGPLHIRNAAYRFDFNPEYGEREMTLHYTLVTSTDHLDGADLLHYRQDYKNMLDRISFVLYKDNSSSDLAPSVEPAPTPGHVGDPADPHAFRPCWPAIWLTFFYALLFSRLFVWLNAHGADSRSVPRASMHSASGRGRRLAAGAGSRFGSGPFSGWVLILGLCIGLGFTLDAWQLFRANYYSIDNWNAWSAAGGASMQWLYLGQLAIQLNFLAGAGAVLYWFLKKRDIFPAMFVGYAAIVLIGRLVLIGMFYSLPIPASLWPYRSDLPWAFARTTMYAAIWITYVLRSGQVRDTFLQRFR